ncbi:MAG: hypothetical protein A4E53_01098 [Pelotomaculum sp. PtaB.Bin104]|nr:MAG: hypothetical protein A4E53_01098 [Pelotomaculum sp. PtaB.Bin104]
MKILDSVEYETKNTYVCHIDETKVDADGNLDPCLEIFDWGKDVPADTAKIEMLRIWN